MGGLADMYKLVALDLDGTLLDDKGRISARDVKALNAFSRKGGMVVLSSGRMTGCVEPFAGLLGLDCSVISYNGAMVRLTEREGRKLLYHEPLESSYSDRIVDFCEREGYLLNYYLDDLLYARGDASLRRYAEIYSGQTKAVYRFVDNLSGFRGKSPTKLILITDSSGPDKSRTRDFLYGYFEGAMGRFVNVARTNPEYLEFFSKKTDKGVALGRLAGHYSIRREEIIAFGDGENDIPMLEYAGLSVAPSNSKTAAAASAGVVSRYDNNNSAVGRFLETI